MNPRPLAGKRILVTRPRAQAQGLSQAIRLAGGEALEFPAIEIRDLPKPASFFAIAERLQSFDIAIFVSRNAVRKALAMLGELRGGISWPANLRVAAIGGGSREELERHGFLGVIAPPAPPDSEALLALPEFADVTGRRIVIFRGQGGRKVLGETLAGRGALVEHAECYRRARPSGNGAALREAWSGSDAATVSSAEGLANLVAMIDEPVAGRLAALPLFVPHARVAAEAERLGFALAVVAGPADRDLIAALAAHFAGAR